MVFLSGCVSGSPEDAGPAADAGRDAGTIPETCFAPSDACANALFFSDCGGTEPPVFACHGGGCRWYTGGCPVRAHATDCPATDLCCHTTEDGLWPFGWEPSSAMAAIEMTYDIAAVGASPVDATNPSQIDVVVDPSIVPPVPVSTEPTCSAGAPLGHCDERYVRFGGVTETDLSLVFRFWTMGEYGQVILVELLPEGSSFSARAFLRDFTDFAFDIVTSCRPFHTEIESGTLRLDRAELTHLGEVHGSIELSLTGGHSFAFQF